jgi:hypothetical protein
MTDLTLDEFRELEPGLELAVKLRHDALMIWDPQTNPAEPESKIEAGRKGRFSILAGWFLRLSFRTSP